MPPKVNAQKLAGLIGALLTVVAGFVLLHFNFRLGITLVQSSYDWSFDLSFFRRANVETGNVVIVYMDEASYRELKQPFNTPWDRALHARLLNRLKTDGARTVIFDIIFSDPGPDESADQALAQAIGSHGQVVLAADNSPAAQIASSTELTALTTLNLPYELFQNAAAGWGLGQLQPDSDFIVRQHYHGPRDQLAPSLSWAAAQALGLELTEDPAARHAERWVNYYGGPETIPHVSYSQALYHDGVKPDFFRDKVVFVGARPITGSFIERRDELRSSFSTWGERFIFMPAVEVHATVLLNLIRGDWLRRLPPAAEWTTLLLIALIFGYGLTRFRPLAATGLALLGMLAFTCACLWLFTMDRVWFPWLIVVAAQIPVALLWAVIYKSIDWYVQKRHLEKERQQAQTRIGEQATLLDKAKDAIFIHDFEWRPIYWNQSAERLYGWTIEEVLQKNLEESAYDRGDPKLVQALETVLATGEWSGELRQSTKAGPAIIVESRWSLLRDEKASPKGILVINTDITAKKQAEIKVRQQAAFLDKAQDAIVVQDFQGQVTYWNKSAERLYGWSAAEMLQAGQSEKLFPKSDLKIQEAWQSVVEKGEWSGELSHQTKAGATVVVETRWKLVRDDFDGGQSILMINTDITEKKLLEAQFLRAQRLESIGVLAGGIAHDLNNVLSPILMGVELLQMKAPDERSRTMLKTIGSSARRGADMVKQVLTFARGQSGERAVLQLAHLLREMQKIARETFPKSIQINTRAAPDLWPVFADATQLHQVLLNLCVNARDAMPDGGEILLSAENHTLDEVAAKRFMDAKAGPYLILAVSDTGAGIPPEIMDRIFEPFFTTKEVGQGTGLGLSTVVSIVKAHGGFLDVQSRLGEGTTFKIYLPAVESTTPLAGVEARRETRRGRGELILVVDDEPAIREMIGAVLADGGYRVAFACHGAEALTLCSQQSDAIALALVDPMMPVLDGPRTIGALRRLKPHLPIIALSGQPQTEETLEQMRSQEVTFLAKPFSREKLFDVLDGRLADPVHRQCPDASEVAE